MINLQGGGAKTTTVCPRAGGGDPSVGCCGVAYGECSPKGVTVRTYRG
jgi:hypothetical protein